MHPPEGPPICTALNALSSLIPPPMLYITSRSDMPIGTSTNPPLFILPASANTFVPLLFSVPKLAKALPPFVIIHGTFAYVSTLFIFVGLPHSPD